MYTLHEKGRKSIKYVTSINDSRTKDIYHIEFRDVVNDKNKIHEKIFNCDDYASREDFKKAIYEFLDEYNPEIPNMTKEFNKKHGEN